MNITLNFDIELRGGPDTLLRKHLGSYKAQMEAIFRAFTEAYDVLGKESGND